MKKQELKELLTPEFLSTLHSAVKCCNWNETPDEVAQGLPKTPFDAL